MHPVLIEVGRFDLPTYGVLVATAVLLGLWTVGRRARRAGLDSGRILDATLWVLICALLGSKLTLVLVELPRYLAHPAELVGVARAGGVFLGGFVAALVAAVVLLRRYGLEWRSTVDVVVPSLALSHAVGRLGCLMAGCCWGRPTDLPWAVTYSDPRAHATLGTPLHVGLHPFPVYEGLYDLLLFVGLSWLYWRRPRPGRVFAAYLVAYGAGRFLLEMTRGDAARGVYFGGALSTSQLIGAAMVATGVGLHWWLGRQVGPAQPAGGG